jgi:hypothetical protein
VTTIGHWAFSGCTSLISFEISNNGASTAKNGKIDTEAFKNCSSLISIEIPDGITMIENDVFVGCSKLAAIKIPQSVTTIGTGACNQCDNLEEVYFDGTREQWQQITIAANNDKLLYTKLYCCDETICEGVFRGNFLKRIDIPEATTTITDNAFKGYKNIETLYIPKSTTTIGNHAFSGCDNLKYIYYEGSKSAWKKIKIGEDNQKLNGGLFKQAKIFYEYKK